MAGTIATPRGTAFAVRASNGFSNGPEDTGLHANARRHTVDSANPLFKGTVAHANARHCTAPVRLITRRSEVAQRASDCRSEGVERACPRFVPQLLWDCPEPQGASGTGMGALPGVLRAVRNLGESSGTPEWRLLWALRRSSDWPGRFARRTRSPGCLGVGRFGPCPCRSTGAGSAEVAAAKAARTPRSLREAVKMCAGRWPAGDGLRRGQFCWPPLGRTVGHQRATTWPPPGRISWPPTPGEVQTSSRSTRPRLRHPDRVEVAEAALCRVDCGLGGVWRRGDRLAARR